MTRWSWLVAVIALAGTSACDRNATSSKPSTAAGSGSNAPGPTNVTLAPAPPVPELPDGLPELPTTTTLNANVIALGAQLFADPLLSASGQTSCATCHLPSKGFGNDEPGVAASGKPNARRTPTLVNLAWLYEFGWDGRYPSLEALLTAHLKGQLGVTAAQASKRLATQTIYQAHAARLAGAARDSDESEVTPPLIVAALASYVVTRYAGNSAWDRAERASRVTPSQALGKQLFTGVAGCANCHSPPLYTDGAYHRIGLVATPDEGRGKVEPALAGAFRTPSLRGLAGRTRFFHDSSAASLEAAIDFHLAGGIGQGAALDLIDPALRPVTLSAEERLALIEFVRLVYAP